MISGYHACKREYTKAPYRLQRNALVIKIRNVLCALCVQVSAITFHINLIFCASASLSQRSALSLRIFSLFLFLSLFHPHTTTHTNTTHPQKKHTYHRHTYNPSHTHHKKSIFSSQLFLLRVKKNTSGACKQLLCAKSFRGACAYDKFPERSDVAMCGGLEIGEALLGYFLCGSKGAFFFGFAVFIFYFFSAGLLVEYSG